MYTYEHGILKKVNRVCNALLPHRKMVLLYVYGYTEKFASPKNLFIINIEGSTVLCCAAMQPYIYDNVCTYRTKISSE